MRLLGRLLAAVVLLTMTGFVHAQGLGCGCGPAARSMFAAERFGIFNTSSVSRPHELIDDVLQVTAGAEDRTSAIAGAARHDQAAARAELTGAALPRLVAGRGNGSARQSRAFSIAPIPEPADWMMPLCGLVVGVFIARRKASWTPD